MMRHLIRRLIRHLYSMLLWLLTPLLLLHLLRRGRRQPEYRQHWAERFGFYSQQRLAGKLIWIHAVSVGETRAAQPLVEALRLVHPEATLLLTHTTPTGRAMSEQLFGNTVLRAYLPYDHITSVRRFLKHVQPTLGVLMETEVWPNLIAEACRAGVPVLLVNARLSARSLKKGQRWSALLRPALQQLSGVLAQTADDAARLRSAGACQVEVTGNLKFDLTPPPEQLQLGQRFKAQIGPRPVLLAASTREGEEALLLDALQSASLPPETLLLIVPRHPQRFDAVAKLIEARGLKMQRRSAGAEVHPHVDAETQVWLGDSMGELFAYYAAASVAFIGGSLLPLGGQNLIEACSVACPVLVGPHTYNFAQATADAVEAGAAMRVADASDLMTQAAALLKNSPRLQQMAVAAQGFAVKHRGATARTMAVLQMYLQRADT